MILLLGIILIIYGIGGLYADHDHYIERHNDYVREERRHRERINAINEQSKQIAQWRKLAEKGTRRKQTRRRVIKTEDYTLGEEITEEYDE